MPLSGLRNHQNGRCQAGEETKRPGVSGDPVIFQPPALLPVESYDHEAGGEEQETCRHAAGMRIKSSHCGSFYLATGAGPTVSFSDFDPNLLQDAFTSSTSSAAASTL